VRERDAGRREEEGRDRVKMKMDSPAVYTKPFGGSTNSLHVGGVG